MEGGTSLYETDLILQHEAAMPAMMNEFVQSEKVELTFSCDAEVSMKWWGFVAHTYSGMKLHNTVTMAGAGLDNSDISVSDLVFDGSNATHTAASASVQWCVREDAGIQIADIGPALFTLSANGKPGTAPP